MFCCFFISIYHILLCRNTSDGNPARLPGIESGNEKFALQLKLGLQRAEERRLSSATSLSVTPPKPEEINFIHSLFLRSKRLEQQLNNRVVKELHAENEEVPKNVIWMSDTIFKNTVLMHLQNRNIFGKMFGGHIMRIAFELGFIVAQCFMGENNVVFLNVNNIQFVRPVSTGSIMEFSSLVVYSSDNYVVVQVSAEHVIGNTLRNKTNVFSYIFQ